ncbi:phosphotransferase family protein [Occultella aeris]|uniref:Phosphotransferase enzyme family protein n=1 Tax=Occultella aeris TaxID=2761496 RepID=A0A7M4DEM3_9MICO|nr:phosphotransferase [Occultella aeris]VZO35366.1 Phosphotransferase enzyme family protein [Occultella aeris]
MTTETRYVRPPQEILDTLLEEGFRAAGEATHPPDPTWIEFGSSTLVVLAGRTALRVARQPSVAAELNRAQALVDALPALPFAVPETTGEPVTIDGYQAIPTLRVEGEPHPPHAGDLEPLRDLLEAVHSLDASPLRPHLAQPRSFMGGADWEPVLRDRVVPLLSPNLQGEARRRIDALAGLEPGEVVVNHGDLAGSNVLWHHGRVSGVLDWDLTALDDPAEDLASLASWHGWALAHELADAATVARADVFRRSVGLQQIAFTLLQDRPADELARVVARAEQRLAG